jgi:hypothetical protein
LVGFGRSVVLAAHRQYGERLVTEPEVSGDVRLLYTETHFALAALLLFLLDTSDTSMLDLAESRLRLWKQGRVPLTFFNSMALCLAAIILSRSGHRHAGLESVLADLLSRTPRRHRDVAYRQYCGNNAYLQQVAVDTVMLPVARGEAVDRKDLCHLLAEFRRYRSSEGLFHDLPRDGTQQERLHPPTYIMKMLFVAGACHELHFSEELAEMFRAGMATVLPLLTRDGNFSYFGRTDNSPFAAGLTIFDLRNATRLCPNSNHAFDHACAAAERYFESFPRTPEGLLKCNRYGDSRSAAQQAYSRDDYAYVGQYSLSSCAYALLGAYWFPAPAAAAPPAAPRTALASIAQSKDLGVLRLAGEGYEVCLRTASQITSWDRRYLGPTVLRYEVGGRLLVGAIPRTISTDERVSRKARPASRLRRAVALVERRFKRGIEQLDGTSVGFLPVLRRGATDFLPSRLLSLEASASRVTSRYGMVALQARGLGPCLIELSELLHRNTPGLRPKYYSRPPFEPVDSLELSREIDLDPCGCSIEDCVSGAPRGTTLLFSVRYMPGASVRIRGLSKVDSIVCWGSDGLQILDTYAGSPSGTRFRYGCEVEVDPAFTQTASQPGASPS